MDTLHTVREWIPSSGAVIGRASDVLDVDLGDVVGEVADAAGDLVEAAGEGIIAAAAATEVASRATAGFVRRNPIVAVLVAGALVGALIVVLGRRRDDARRQETLRAAA